MSTKITNCHTHIFNIDHVPNKFSKGILPWPFYHLLTMAFVKWYYNHFTSRGSYTYRRFIHKLKKIKYFLIRVLKFTYILWWIYLLIFYFMKWFWDIFCNFFRLSVFVGPETRKLIDRYMTLARYSANYQSQSRIYSTLKGNYPVGSQHIVLPMDMDYMGAGKAREDYMTQMAQLKKLGDRHSEMRPFLHADPRRIKATAHFTNKDNYFKLMQSYLDKGHFHGIKLYPALGYYPFDKNLIPLYEFAMAKNFPIMVHCSKGPVFYRGKKKKEWAEHPILDYNKQSGHYVKIPLPQKKNVHFTSNFTHPLNYECLLNKNLLSAYLGESKDLSQLKICMGHFGGDEEWDKYRADAFNRYNNNISPISQSEYQALPYKTTLNHGSKRTIWWGASWLSIIYDLMVKYDNVYADVSFILHREDLFPLLKYLLIDPKVKNRILFGSDFYVVSHKGLDKELYQNLRSHLGDKLFKLIAIDNPSHFLK